MLGTNDSTFNCYYCLSIEIKHWVSKWPAGMYRFLSEKGLIIVFNHFQQSIEKNVLTLTLIFEPIFVSSWNDHL